MGITKGQLKSIVKECLIEILAEGMGPNTKETVLEAAKSVKSSERKQTVHHSSALQQNASRVRVNSSAIKEAIKREAGGDNIMASILADTAANTLPTMLENDSVRISSPRPTGAVERVVASASPEDLFGEEAASKWADLAFMGTHVK